jgi:hypothetical protein
MTGKTATTTAIARPEDLQVEASPVVQNASSLVVTSRAESAGAMDVLREIKARRKKIDETFDEHISSAHKAHKALVAKKKTFTDELDQAERIIKGKIGNFELAERKRADEEERIRREEAEKDRLRLLGNAQGKITKAMGASAKIEEQIAALHVVIASPDSSELEAELAARQVEVLRLKLEGQQEKAIEAQRAAEIAVDAVLSVAPATTTYERTKGVRTEKVPEVRDKMALIRAVAAGKVPDAVLEVDLGKVKKLINMGVNIGVQEGVLVSEKPIVSVR